MYAVRSEGFEDFFSLPGDPDRRGAEVVIYDLDVVPGYLPSPPGSKRLHHRLLGRIACREALIHTDTFRLAIAAFRIGEDALGEPLGSFEALAYAIHFNDVDADGYDQ